MSIIAKALDAIGLADKASSAVREVHESAAALRGGVEARAAEGSRARGPDRLPWSVPFLRLMFRSASRRAGTDRGAGREPGEIAHQ